MVNKQLEDAAYEAMRVLKGMMDDRYQKPAYALQAALYKAKQETISLPIADYETQPITPHPLDTIAAVQTFMLTAGQEVKPSPGQPTPEVLKLRLALELEELYEKAQAFGLEGTFCEMLSSKAIEADNRWKAGCGFLSFDSGVYDAVEVLDAAVDQRYVQDGTVLACGLQDAFPEAFANVQASNMSKFPDSAALAQASCTAYGDQGIDTGYKPAGTTGRYVIHRLGDGKVLKSKDYIPASLGPILEKHSAK